MRDKRKYWVHLQDDDFGEETRKFSIPAGTKKEQDAAAWDKAAKIAEDWAHEGDWGDDGYSVLVMYWIEDEEYEEHDFDPRWITIDIDPDEDALIEAAGGDTECNHEWSSEGEGGCDENPGVWSLGGTTLEFRSHCIHCGIIRTEIDPGSQRNPGEHRRARFELPE